MSKERDFVNLCDGQSRRYKALQFSRSRDRAFRLRRAGQTDAKILGVYLGASVESRRINRAIAYSGLACFWRAGLSSINTSG